MYDFIASALSCIIAILLVYVGHLVVVARGLLMIPALPRYVPRTFVMASYSRMLMAIACVRRSRVIT